MLLLSLREGRREGGREGGRCIGVVEPKGGREGGKEYIHTQLHTTHTIHTH